MTTTVSNYDLERAAAKLRENRYPVVGFAVDHPEHFAQRLVWEALSGETIGTDEGMESWLAVRGGADHRYDLKRIEEITAAALLQLQSDPAAIHDSEYGGVYQVYYRGNVMAEFVPGPFWSESYALLREKFGEELSYRWKATPRSDRWVKP